MQLAVRAPLGISCSLQVCQHYASKLLSGTRQPMIADELMRAWQEAVPEGMQPTLAMLRGEAILIGASTFAF